MAVPHGKQAMASARAVHIKLPAPLPCCKSNHTHGYGFMLFIIVLGVVEFSFGLYGHKWTRKKRRLISRASQFPKLVFAPFLPGSA